MIVRLMSVTGCKRRPSMYCILLYRVRLVVGKYSDTREYRIYVFAKYKYFANPFYAFHKGSQISFLDVHKGGSKFS